MLDLDQVESQFRAAVKQLPQFERPEVANVLVITDLEAEEAESFGKRCRTFVSELSDAKWSVLNNQQHHSIKEMLNSVEHHAPSMVVSYRHLFEDEDLPYSLGSYIDTLTQSVETPVLLVPNPRHKEFVPEPDQKKHFLVLTDHITQDHSLVNWSLRFLENGGQLDLAHVEDDLVFNRYIDAISKIPGLDTELAKKAIDEKLLSQADHYMEDVRKGVSDRYPKVSVGKHIRRGHTVKDLMDIIGETQPDVVVMNTKDDSQQAMHGASYSLSIELNNQALLLL